LLPDVLKANLMYSRCDYPTAADIYRKAINWFERGLYVPTLYSCETLTFLYEFQGQVLNKVGKYEETKTYFPGVRKINPDYYSPTLAKAFLRTKDYASAISEFEAYLASNPSDASSRSSLGEIYLYSRQYKNALPELEKAVKTEPGNPRYHFLYGLALSGDGHKQYAAVQFRKTIQLDPNSVYAKEAKKQLKVLER